MPLASSVPVGVRREVPRSTSPAHADMSRAPDILYVSDHRPPVSSIRNAEPDGPATTKFAVARLPWRVAPTSGQLSPIPTPSFRPQIIAQQSFSLRAGRRPVPMPVRDSVFAPRSFRPQQVNGESDRRTLVRVSPGCIGMSINRRIVSGDSREAPDSGLPNSRRSESLPAERGHLGN